MQKQSQKLEWSDLAVILAVARAGTLSGAARHLGLNHSTVFRKINAIEERTGVRFFDRLPSGYRATEAGEAAMTCAERIESEVHTLGREILGQDMRLQGHVRVTAMEGLAAQVLPGPVAEFVRQNRGVSVEIVGTVSALDLSRREAEVAVRATRKPPENAVGRKICDFQFAVYAAERYLQGREDLPLHEHDWCMLKGINAWLVPVLFKKLKDVEEQTVLTCSSIIGVVEAAMAGAGLTLLPCYVGEAEPRLVRVGAPLPQLTLKLWLLTHPDLRETVRVRALIDFLYDVLLQQRELFDPTP
jgi:DNA-binding transcriptional LysR family regulator